MAEVPEEWPIEEEETDKEVINQEVHRISNRFKKKSSVVAIVENTAMGDAIKVPKEEDISWYLRKLSKYSKILRIVASILRFIDYCKKNHTNSGEAKSKKDYSCGVTAK